MPICPVTIKYIWRVKQHCPNVRDYIENLFDNFFEQRGDRLYRDDHSIIGGIAMFHDMPVTVIGHQKGKNLEENLLCNFGMQIRKGIEKHCA